MTRDGLFAHYRRHYAPNNAYFIVAGDAPATELLDRAAAAFGSLDAEAPIEPPKAPEPPQYGERRVIVRRAGGALPIIQVGHKAPRAADPRAPALSALAVTLAGATAGGGEAASGRAWRCGQLLATGAAASLGEWYDQLSAVTAEDVGAAAESVFQEKGRTVGWFVPEES